MSNLGNVRNKKTGIILKNGVEAGGYCTVILCEDKQRKKHKVHRLVALTFIENPENKRY